MKGAIKKILFGDTVVTEYSKITIPANGIHEKVWLELNGHLTDVSQQHWILCIEPLVFGVWVSNDVLPAPVAGKTGFRLYFSDGAQPAAGVAVRPAEQPAVAIVSLELMEHIREHNGTLLLLQVQRAGIHHFNYIKTQLLFSRYYKKEGMPFKRFSSFVSAYSYPRRIRLVSFRQDGYYNFFPMDLLGPVPGADRYVFGLRHTNVTLARILETGRLAVAEIPFEHKDAVYQLAKHHSSSPPAIDSLPFDVVESNRFGFYIPHWAVSYKEINIVQTMNLGSHMLMWGIPMGETVLNGPAQHLYLLHFMEYFHQKLNGLAYTLA